MIAWAGDQQRDAGGDHVLCISGCLSKRCCAQCAFMAFLSNENLNSSISSLLLSLLEASFLEVPEQHIFEHLLRLRGSQGRLPGRSDIKTKT